MFPSFARGWKRFPFALRTVLPAVAGRLLAKSGARAGTEADIAIGIRPGIIHIERERPSAQAIIPIAAAKREATRLNRPLSADLFEAADHPADLLEHPGDRFLTL